MIGDYQFASLGKGTERRHGEKKGADVLPDLPGFKQDLQNVLTRYLRKATHERLGVFSEVPQHTVHEGMTMRVYRADGTSEDTAMKEVSAEMMMKWEDIPRMTIADRIAKMNEMAETMAKQMSAHLFTSMNESLEKAGQVIDGRGRPFNFETVFEVLEKLQVDFDKDDKPKDLSFVVGPALIPRVREMIEQSKTDPSIKRRHDELMARKWLEWRDREAARKLVG